MKRLERGTTQADTALCLACLVPETSHNERGDRCMQDRRPQGLTQTNHHHPSLPGHQTRSQSCQSSEASRSPCSWKLPACLSACRLQLCTATTRVLDTPWGKCPSTLVPDGQTEAAPEASKLACCCCSCCAAGIATACFMLLLLLRRRQQPQP